ncbi:MAG: peptidylprolyl isomerase [Paludibacteraceae bacterium]|nr:peptidylprolyl isomerase [Paludibacteraceae bacterium]
MKRIVLLAAFVSTLFVATAQVSEDASLVIINGRKSTVGEFMYIYNKNNQETQVEKKSIDEYLDLFINYKLKVEAARDAGVDTTEAFRKELEQYRSQAIPKYMVNSDDEQAVIEKVYNRMLEDRIVSHIAIRCPENATAEQEAEALEKINKARIRVTTGLPIVKGKGKKAKTLPGVVEDFTAVADEVSEDPAVKESHGRVGVVRPLYFVYPFENAAYKTSLGQVSEVFRTPFGFHILKVESVEPHQEIRASHIMMQTPRGVDSIAQIAKEKIDSLYKELEAGADFAKMAFENSQDRGSAMRGGDLGWFGKGQMVPEFEKAAFALTKEGELSEPIHSQYGWHIIRLAGRRNLQPLDSIRKDLERKIHRSEYQMEIDDMFTDRLKKEYDFLQADSALEQFYLLGEKYNIADSAFKAQAAMLNGDLFSFAYNKRSQADFAEFISQNDKTQSKVMRRAIDRLYKQYVARELRNYENSRLEGKYRDLKNLMTEYHDGIMLFEVSLKEVWDKASTDTAGLRKFFNENKQNYLWEAPKYKGFVVYCKDKNIQKIAKQIVKNADRDSVESYLQNRLNLDSVEYVKVKKGLWSIGENSAVDKFGFKIKDAEFTPDEEFPLVFVYGKKLLGADEYTDERGQVTSDYQDYLEKEWIKTLKEKYPVTINKEVLYYLKAAEENKPQTDVEE